jgi:hypothetical protein
VPFTNWIFLKQAYEKFRADPAVVTFFGPYLQRGVNEATMSQFRADLAKTDGKSQEQIRKSQELISYSKAVERIYDFASDVIFYPTQLCMVDMKVVKGSDSEAFRTTIEFSQVQKNVYITTGKTVWDCEEASQDLNDIRYQLFSANDPSVTDIEITAVTKVGTSYREQTPMSVSDVEKAFTTVDPIIYSAGLSRMKDYARMVLFTRQPFVVGNLLAAGESIFPNFMDDARFRDRMETRLKEAVLRGTPLKEFGINSTRPDKSEVRSSSYYELENHIYATATSFRNTADYPGITNIQTKARVIEDRNTRTTRAAFEKVWPAQLNSNMVYGFDLGGDFCYADRNRNTIGSLLLEEAVADHNLTWLDIGERNGALDCIAVKLVPDEKVWILSKAEESQEGALFSAIGFRPKDESPAAIADANAKTLAARKAMLSQCLDAGSQMDGLANLQAFLRAAPPADPKSATAEETALFQAIAKDLFIQYADHEIDPQSRTALNVWVQPDHFRFLLGQFVTIKRKIYQPAYTKCNDSTAIEAELSGWNLAGEEFNTALNTCINSELVTTAMKNGYRLMLRQAILGLTDQFYNKNALGGNVIEPITTGSNEGSRMRILGGLSGLLDN